MGISNSQKSECKMDGIQIKITRPTQKQENITYNEEDNESIETDPELKQM